MIGQKRGQRASRSWTLADLTLFDTSNTQEQDAATTQSALTGIAMPAHSTSRQRSLAAAALPPQRTTARPTEKRLDSFIALGQLGRLQ